MENTAVCFTPMERAMVGNSSNSMGNPVSGILGNGNFMAAFIEAMQGEIQNTEILNADGKETDENNMLSELLKAFKSQENEEMTDDALMEALASTLMDMFPVDFNFQSVENEVSENGDVNNEMLQIKMLTENILKELNTNDISVEKFFGELKQMGMPDNLAEQLKNTDFGSKNEISSDVAQESNKLLGNFCLNLQKNISGTQKAELSPVSLFNSMRGTAQKVGSLDSESKKTEKNNDLANEQAALNTASQVKSENVKSYEPIKVSGIEENDIEKQIVFNVEKALNEQKSEIVMKLSPESLGEITVKIVKEGGKLNVDLISTMQETARLLENSQGELKNALKLMNENVTVTTSHANAENNLAQFFNGQRQWQGQQSRQDNLHHFNGYQQSQTTESESIILDLNETSSKLLARYA